LDTDKSGTLDGEEVRSGIAKIVHGLAAMSGGVNTDLELALKVTVQQVDVFFKGKKEITRKEYGQLWEALG